MNILVGYTGFVGSNINDNYQFDGLYNSKNIEESFGTNPDLLVYCGVRAEKFLANRYPEKDKRIIEESINNIVKINPRNIVLISTIDVYKNPYGVNEDSVIDLDGLHPYGYNRYYLEQWVENNCKDHLILRLPGLYGKNIKKNFIYDLINNIPSMLNEVKFTELKEINSLIEDYYLLQDNGFYKCKELLYDDRKRLNIYFEAVGFSALNFTDSRGCFQFYNLKYLWNHINHALDNNIQKMNIATEPVKIDELYRYIMGKDFVNNVSKEIPYYDFKTKYAELYGARDGYIFNKEFILSDIKEFVGENKE